MLVRPRPTLLLAACGLALLVSPTPARAGARYTLTNLNTLSGGKTYVNAINNVGQIVGSFRTAEGQYDAFLYSNGAMTDLNTHGIGGSALGINNAGDIVGSASKPGEANDAPQAYLYSKSNGSVTFLGAIGGDQTSSAYGINDAGQVVGGVETPGSHGGSVHGFLYSNGSITDLDFDDHATAPTGINASGQIVGTFDSAPGSDPFLVHAFLYSDGSITDLGTLGGEYSFGFGINDAGQVVGHSQNADGNGRAFLYADGSMTDLGDLGGRGGGWAYGINNAGQIVGYSSTASDTHAFLYEGGTMIDLNTLIDPNLGVTLREATAINDRGQIVGYGADAGGNNFAFLLTPTAVPEPSSIVLLGLAGIAGVALRHRGRTLR